MRSRLQKVLLERNLPSDVATKDSPEDNFMTKPLVIHEALVVRICLNSSKMVFEKGTSDFFVYNTTASVSRAQAPSSNGGENENDNEPAASAVATAAANDEDREMEADKEAFRREIRAEKLKEKMVTNNAWMKGLSHEDVQKANNEFQMWKETEAAIEQDDSADVTMEG